MAKTFEIRKTRDGYMPGQPSFNNKLIDTHYSRESAISRLFEIWDRWVNDKFYYLENGEQNDIYDEDGQPIIFRGESGWYRDGCGSPEFPKADYPHSADEWVARDIQSFRDDVWTYHIVEADESDDEINLNVEGEHVTLAELIETNSQPDVTPIQESDLAVIRNLAPYQSMHVGTVKVTRR